MPVSAIVVTFAMASLSLADAPPASVKIGEAAPLFDLKSADGKSYKLADYKDKIVVLEWWNKDCPFSNHKGAQARMKEIQAGYAAKGVVWLAIDSTAAHDAKSVIDYAKEHEITYPILMDTDGAVGHTYAAKTTPHIYVIHNGKLVYMGAHDNKSERNYIVESVDALLAGKPVPVAETKSYGCSVKYKR